MGNMYGDSKDGVSNIFVGCEFDCIYCQKSFQAQMKRQMHNCRLCYEYIPHLHYERLSQKLPKTEGDEFIWLVRSGDPSFMSEYEFSLFLWVIEQNPDKMFLIQTKNPKFLESYIDYIREKLTNVIIGITLETNRDYEVSKAPTPTQRWSDLIQLEFYYPLSITIEPILDFDMKPFIFRIKALQPERVYIGYDTKNSGLPEPSLQKTTYLIESLKSLGIKVKTKLLREAHG